MIFHIHQWVPDGIIRTLVPSYYNLRGAVILPEVTMGKQQTRNLDTRITDWAQTTLDRIPFQVNTVRKHFLIFSQPFCNQSHFLTSLANMPFENTFGKG